MRRNTLVITAVATACLGLVGPALATAAPSAGPRATVAGTTLALPAEGSRYLVGAGIYDITGAVAETGAFGYASQQEMVGLQQRLYSRAFVVADPDSGTRVAVVTADLGAIFQSVKLEVVKELRARYGDRYTDDNVLLAATHTHIGNSGLSQQTLYQIAGMDSKLYGYSSQNFKAVVSGIVESIARADAHLEPGSIQVNQGRLDGATKNRSLAAFRTNKDVTPASDTVDTAMTQLTFRDAKGRPLGLLNWFAIHPTSFNMHWTQIGGDNKGYAAAMTERKQGAKPTDAKPFVAAFAQSDVGDNVSVDGTSVAAPGYQGDPDDFVNAERAGKRQLARSEELFAAPGKPVTGPVDFRARWADFGSYTVGAEFTQGAGAQRLCKPARGFSFATGGENGPSNIPGIYEGMTKGTFSVTDAANKVDRSALGTLVRTAFVTIGGVYQDPCQAEKPVLLPTGAWGWVPTVLPVQLVRIGNVALVALPGEATTTAGRRLRETVQAQLGSAGVDTVVLAGIANTYSGYVATREEYAAQHYEGASTEFGPHELGAFQQEFTRLAGAMRTGAAVQDDKQPEDRSGRTFLERPGVAFDDKPGNEQWGQVLTQPKAAYKPGETVSVTFRSGHPKNDLHTMGTYLEVQRWDGAAWVTVLTDRDWETSFLWKREGAALSRATVVWRTTAQTPAGRYRVVHHGDWKNGWNGRISPYTGTSQAFDLR